MVLNKDALILLYSGGASKNTPDGNQGGVASSVQIPEQDLSTTPFTYNTFFRNITAQERNNGITLHTCVYIKNNGDATAYAPKIYTFSDTPDASNIRLGRSSNAVNVLEQSIVSTTSRKYECPTSSSDSNLDHEFKRIGEKITSSSFSAVGTKPTSLKVHLFKEGSGHTGNITMTVRNSSHVIKGQYSTLAAADVLTSSTAYEFTLVSEPTGTNWTLEVNDIVWVEWPNGTSSRIIQVIRNGSDPVSGGHLVNYDNSTVRNVTGYDLAGEWFVAGNDAQTIAPDGITFENPNSLDTAITLPDMPAGAICGIWLRLEVPPASGNYPNGKFAIRRVFQADT